MKEINNKGPQNNVSSKNFNISLRQDDEFDDEESDFQRESYTYVN